MTGTGDPVLLVRAIPTWPLHTREFVDLLHWARAWNATAPQQRRVTLIGIDLGLTPAAQAIVETFLRPRDPALASQFASVATALTARAMTGKWRSIPETRKAEYAAVLDATVDAIRSFKGKTPGDPRAEEAENAAVSAQEDWEVYSPRLRSDAGNNRRDQLMAANVLRYRRQHPASRIFLWAHNEHITRAPGAMGSFIAAALHNDYVPIGFAFGSGEFKAVDIGPTRSSTTPFHTFTVSTPDSSNLDGWLAHAAPDPLFIVDVRQIPKELATCKFREIGAVFSPTGYHFGAHKLPRDFDFLAFVRQTTATQPV
jgi:erythromycin esterase